MDPTLWIAAFGVAFVAGLVKGVVGFGVPTLMISGLTVFLPVEVALAALIGTALVSNVAQALRQGARAAWASVVAFRRFVGLVMVFIALSAQLVPLVPERWLFGFIGVAVILLALAQMRGWRLRFTPQERGRYEWIMGGITGFVGGLSGIWGPPTVAFLVPLDLSKAEFVRVQGVVYGLGAVVLAGAHIGSGVLNAQTVGLSLWLILPGMAGLWVGFQVQDRMDRVMFLRVTLVVLLIAGANLVRRAVF